MKKRTFSFNIPNSKRIVFYGTIETDTYENTMSIRKYIARIRQEM